MIKPDYERVANEKATKFSFRKLEDPHEPSIVQEIIIKPAQIDEVISFLLQARKHFELVHTPLIH